MQINPQTKITMLNSEFVSLMNDVLQDTSLDSPQIVAVNFRDPTYSAERGDYHPVEIHVDENGNLLSITDFAYVGIPPFDEIGIELDWSFEQNQFRQYDCWYDLECGRGLLGLYLANFTAYYRSGVYRVEVTTL